MYGSMLTCTSTIELSFDKKWVSEDNMVMDAARPRRWKLPFHHAIGAAAGVGRALCSPSSRSSAAAARATKSVRTTIKRVVVFAVGTSNSSYSSRVHAVAWVGHGDHYDRGRGEGGSIVMDDGQGVGGRTDCAS